MEGERTEKYTQRKAAFEHSLLFLILTPNENIQNLFMKTVEKLDYLEKNGLLLELRG